MHIITMLMLLSILILVHELGHFGVARMLGIKVERFGFGLPFGPILYETKWGETKICIHAFLLGGYVSFPDDDPDCDLPKDDPRRISNKKVWERFAVVSAGVTANAILAYFLVLFVAGFSGGLPSGDYNIFVKDLQKDNGLAANQIGIKPEDKILSVNKVEINSPLKFIELAKRSKKFDGYVADKKVSEQINQILTLNPELKKNLGSNQIIAKGTTVKLPEPISEEPLEINDDTIAGVANYTPDGNKLSENQISLRNKLENKKEFVADGKTSLQDLAYATSDTVHPLNIQVQRDGKKFDLPTAYPNKKGKIGIKLKSEEIKVPTNGPINAITGSWDYLYRNVSYMLKGLGMIATGQVHFTDLHGIVAITKVGSDIIAEKGMWDGLLLTALISMDLAIVNLLPIPALDGGHLLFLLIEKLRGKPVKEETQETFAKWGFTILIGLMVLIVFNDIWALITDKI